MDVTVESSGGKNHPLPCYDFGARPHHHGRIDAVLDERIATVTDTRNPTLLHPDVRLDDALNGVEVGGVGDHEV